MTASLRAGDRVVHAGYGTGTVLGLQGTRRIRVRFDRQRLLPRTVSVDQVAAGDEAPGVAAAAGTSPPPARFAAAERMLLLARLRQTVEALRLGVVPAHHVADYTVGRGPQIDDIRRLCTAGQGLRLIWGEYGAGKTHLLDVAEQLALGLGYVTARVVLDPREVPPSHPKRLYASIVGSLRYPEQAGRGLEPLLASLAGSRRHLHAGGRGFSRFLSPALFAHGGGDPELAAWAVDYAEGQAVDAVALARALHRAGWRNPPPLALSDYRTYGRVYVHMVGTLASWSRDAGFRGLTVLFDEVERLDALDAAHRRYALEVLRHYAAATLPEQRLAFREADLYRGGHPVHRRLPLRYRAAQPLVVLMTLTPLPETQAATGRILTDHTQELYLPPLGRVELGQLVDRVIALYRRAYPEFEPPLARLEPIRRGGAERARAGEDRPREVVRATVAALDAVRHGLELSPRHLTSA